jgi:hypothetical protein
MLVILQTWCLIQRTPSCLRYMHCVPGHIQCISSSIYSDFNIRLNVSALLFEIIGHYDARYTATLVPYIAHTLQFTLCELWSRTYTLHLQLRIFRLQWSSERICAAIGDISTVQCASYCKHWAQHSPHHPVYAMCTVVPEIHNVSTTPHIQATIFKWTYLRWYWTYPDISMRVILQIWCQIQGTPSSLRCVNCGPVHI